LIEVWVAVFNYNETVIQAQLITVYLGSSSATRVEGLICYSHLHNCFVLGP